MRKREFKKRRDDENILEIWLEEIGKNIRYFNKSI